jgi:hypothetical protein
MAEAHRKVVTLQENELVFEFVGAIHAQVFDGDAHGLSHCMKAVDFVVEYPDHELFVEVKDPDQTDATPERKAIFENKLKSHQLVRDLARKYRDSWLYRWAEQRDKPVRYVLFLQLSTLGAPDLLTLADKLKHELPLHGGPSWRRTFVERVAVLDMHQWNAWGRYGTVRRVPRAPGVPS